MFQAFRDKKDIADELGNDALGTKALDAGGAQYAQLIHTAETAYNQMDAGLYSLKRVATYLKRMVATVETGVHELRKLTEHEGAKLQLDRYGRLVSQQLLNLLSPPPPPVTSLNGFTKRQTFSSDVNLRVVEPLMTFWKAADKKRRQIYDTLQTLIASMKATDERVRVSRGDALKMWQMLKDSTDEVAETYKDMVSHFNARKRAALSNNQTDAKRISTKAQQSGKKYQKVEKALMKQRVKTGRAFEKCEEEVAGANVYQSKHYIDLLPPLMHKIQTIDIARSHAIQTYMDVFCEIEREMLEEDMRNLVAFRKSVGTDVESCLAAFVNETLRAKAPFPPSGPPAFESGLPCTAAVVKSDEISKILQGFRIALSSNELDKDSATPTTLQDMRDSARSVVEELKKENSQNSEHENSQKDEEEREEDEKDDEEKEDSLAPPMPSHASSASLTSLTMPMNTAHASAASLGSASLNSHTASPSASAAAHGAGPHPSLPQHPLHVMQFNASPDKIHMGERCEAPGPGERRGVIAYVGKLDNTDYDPNWIWVGVKFDHHVGQNDGVWKGTRYFQCDANQGSFFPVHTIKVGDYPLRAKVSKHAHTASTSTSGAGDDSDDEDHAGNATHLHFGVSPSPVSPSLTSSPPILHPSPAQLTLAVKLNAHQRGASTGAGGNSSPVSPPPKLSASQRSTLGSPVTLATSASASSSTSSSPSGSTSTPQRSVKPGPTSPAVSPSSTAKDKDKDGSRSKSSGRDRPGSRAGTLSGGHSSGLVFSATITEKAAAAASASASAASTGSPPSSSSRPVPHLPKRPGATVIDPASSLSSTSSASSAVTSPASSSTSFDSSALASMFIPPGSNGKHPPPPLPPRQTLNNVLAAALQQTFAAGIPPPPNTTPPGSPPPPAPSTLYSPPGSPPPPAPSSIPPPPNSPPPPPPE